MLMENRFDDTIGYPAENMYIGKMIGVSKKMTTIPIQETMCSYSFSYIACPNNKWVIDEAN